MNCVHCVLVTCLLLKSDFPEHLKRNFDTSPTVTSSMTTGVKHTSSRVEFSDTHVECTLNPMCQLAEDPDANASVESCPTQKVNV